LEHITFEALFKYQQLTFLLKFRPYDSDTTCHEDDLIIRFRQSLS